MNNKPYITAFIIAIASLTGCQKKVIYATPQITGQVIDKQTNQPIEGVNTFIDDQASDTTDKKGYFRVPPVTYEYTINEPSHRMVMSSGSYSFTIYKPGYEIKSYANGGLAFTPLSRRYDEMAYVNMGKVYLMPVTVGKEREYRTHYSTLGFCQPNESQLEVACIPVPKGKTYEEVSPNRPLK